MNSTPKIFVVKMREIIYTLVLVFLVILLVVCLFLMFSPKASDSGQVQNAGSQNQTSQTTESAQQDTSLYTPGVYTAPVALGDSSVDVEVTVDANHINSIRLVNLSETVTAAYPLVTPSLEHIASQILAKQSLEEITCPSANKYTSQLLLSAVSEALARAGAGA